MQVDKKLIEKTVVDYQPLGSLEFDKITKLVIRAACRGSWLLLDNL